MNTYLKTWLILLVLAAGCNEKVVQKQISEPRQLPLEEFFKNPETFRYRLSPDGKFLSYLAPYRQRQNIFVKNLADQSVVQVTSDTSRDIRLYFWANNDQLVYLQDKGGDENWHLLAADRSGKSVKDLTDYENVRVEIINDLEQDENHMIIGMNKRDPRIFDAYRLNLKTGEAVLVAENPGNITGWLTDHEGKLRLAITTDGVNQSVLYRDSETENFRTVLTTSYKDSFQPLFFTFDNQNLYASSNLGRDKAAIIVFNPAIGKEVEEVFSDPEYDVDGLAYSSLRKVITYAYYQREKPVYHFFDGPTLSVYEKIRKQIDADLEIQLLPGTKDEDKLILATNSDRTGSVYHVYDIPGEKLELIADTQPWLVKEEMAPMIPIQYASRDGITIHGYLTLPLGKEAKNLPVVINPHGGPWYRDTWGFNSEVQFLANRGYAVLQMNFRGSTGYGKQFIEASFKQWGKNMQNDITDGVKWLIEQGIADPERIGIYGASYGGYATLAGLTLTPELYSCGIDYVGVSNLFTFMKTIPPYWEPYLEMMHEMIGHPEKDSLEFVKTSPVFQADRIIAPLLIAQGANDPRVNKDESDQMVESLRARGIEVEYMVKDNEGHGFSNEENKFEFYRAMEKFLGQHLHDVKPLEKPI